MTLSEVLVAAVVLGISGQVSASGWSRAAAAAGQGETLQQMLQRSDEQLLAARRLLNQSGSDHLLAADGSCRFNASALLETLADVPSRGPDLSTRLNVDPAGDALWLQISLARAGDTEPLMRRRLFTPAGLGLCEEVEP